MATHVLSHIIPADEFALSRWETRVETPAFPEPNQEWSAVLRITFGQGLVVDSELEQFVLNKPGGRARRFSADAIQRSQPELAQTLRAQADSWLRAKLADR